MYEMDVIDMLQAKLHPWSRRCVTFQYWFMIDFPSFEIYLFFFFF